MHMHDHDHSPLDDFDDGDNLRRTALNRLWTPDDTTAPAGHVCPDCGASFPTDAALLEHMTTVHRKIA
jgi:hypothetical protein